MLFKKLVSACLLPFPLALALVLVGLASLRFTKRRRLGRVSVATGLIVLLLGGYGLLAAPLLGQLERPYTPLTPDAIAQLSPAPTAVVVLGAGYRADDTLPPNDRLSMTALARLIEGVRLWRLRPQMRLVLSGGDGQAEALAETAVVLGVARSQVILENVALDTAEEAQRLRPLLGADRFLLVTSAAHMRRSMALCRKRGLSPVAAPTAFMTGGDGWSAFDLIPKASGLVLADQALHEWLGLLWARLRGEI
jgi:uncharacterized SAM-binding protein YcdF (DUF218 family)